MITSLEKHYRGIEEFSLPMVYSKAVLRLSLYHSIGITRKIILKKTLNPDTTERNIPDTQTWQHKNFLVSSSICLCLNATPFDCILIGTGFFANFLREVYYSGMYYTFAQKKITSFF